MTSPPEDIAIPCHRCNADILYLGQGYRIDAGVWLCVPCFWHPDLGKKYGRGFKATVDKSGGEQN